MKFKVEWKDGEPFLSLADIPMKECSNKDGAFLLSRLLTNASDERQNGCFSFDKKAERFENRFGESEQFDIPNPTNSEHEMYKWAKTVLEIRKWASGQKENVTTEWIELN